MKYDGDIAYNEAHFNYDGVYVVSPESFGLSSNFGGLNILSVILIAPPSIQSTLVFVDSHTIYSTSGILENSETSSSISFVSFFDYGIMEIDKILDGAYAMSSLNNQEPYSSGYVGISIDKNDAYAVLNAESIILNDNSAGTMDITIISNI